MHAKHCHRALQVRTRLLGLELLDLLVLVVVCYPVGLFLHVFLALAMAVVLGTCLRLLKWGRLPDYTLDLVVYLLVAPEHTAAIGADHAPLHHRAQGRHHANRA
jgi:hypothetical protein